jgi:hypothetical protein
MAWVTFTGSTPQDNAHIYYSATGYDFTALFFIPTVFPEDPFYELHHVDWHLNIADSGEVTVVDETGDYHNPEHVGPSVFPQYGNDRYSWYVEVDAWYKHHDYELWIHIPATSGTLHFWYGELAKAHDPTPTHASGPGIDFSDCLMSWVNDGGPDDYDVYIGPAVDDLVLMQEGYASTSRMTSALELEELFDRSPIEGTVYWRIDSNYAGGYTIEGDVWSFDPRPGVVTNPTPSDTATGQTLSQVLTWEGAVGADTYSVYAGDSGLVSLGDPISGVEWSEVGWGHDTTYTWRVDSTNQFGTTEGDEWTFTTLALRPPSWLWPESGYVVAASKFAIHYTKMGG